MECPYCSGSMKLGTIKADNLLSWTPDGESAEGFTRWATSPNGIVLAKYSLFYQATVDAYYCPTCNKIIIDVAKVK
ncbi:MAG: PF20097 family protein [Candidatus Fimivivens sp.]|nr:PF20097 family protein [Candidatus Fimivivens sp.]